MLASSVPSGPAPPRLDKEDKIRLLFALYDAPHDSTSDDDGETVLELAKYPVRKAVQVAQ